MSNNIVLTDEGLRILRYIQEGHDVMCELFDMTGWPGEKISAVVETLDENRYIERESLQGLKFWSFHLTGKGRAALPPLSRQDAALQPYGLCMRDAEILRFIQRLGKSRATDAVAKFSDDRAKQFDLSGSVVKLLRKKYLKESGFLKRIVEINSKGNELLTKLDQDILPQAR